MVTARRGDKTLTRNSSFFKKLGKTNQPMEVNTTDNEYDYFDDADGQCGDNTHCQQEQLPPVQEPRHYPQCIQRPPRCLMDDV